MAYRPLIGFPDARQAVCLASSLGRPLSHQFRLDTVKSDRPEKDIPQVSRNARVVVATAGVMPIVTETTGRLSAPNPKTFACGNWPATDETS